MEKEINVLFKKKNGKPMGYAPFDEIVAIKIVETEDGVGDGIFVKFSDGKCAIAFNTKADLVDQVGEQRLEKVLL